MEKIYRTNHKKLSRQHTWNMRAVESIQPSKMKSQILEAHHASFPCHSQTCHWQVFGGCFEETYSNETASVRVNFSTINDWHKLLLVLGDIIIVCVCYYDQRFLSMYKTGSMIFILCKNLKFL